MSTTEVCLIEKECTNFWCPLEHSHLVEFIKLSYLCCGVLNNKLTVFSMGYEPGRIGANWQKLLSRADYWKNMDTYCKSQRTIQFRFFSDRNPSQPPTHSTPKKWYNVPMRVPYKGVWKSFHGLTNFLFLKLALSLCLYAILLHVIVILNLVSCLNGSFL